MPARITRRVVGGGVDRSQSASGPAAPPHPDGSAAAVGRATRPGGGPYTAAPERPGGPARAPQGEPMARFDGKVVIVTGAARGQGEAEARLFASQGAKVVWVGLPVPSKTPARTQR